MDSLEATGLKHNLSLDQDGQSPGLKNAITKEVIDEGDEEDQEEHESIMIKNGTLAPDNK